MPYPSPHELREEAEWRIVVIASGIIGLLELAVVAGLLAL